MKNSNLDIWAIQNDKEEFHDALKNVTSSRNNILFRNCLCTFKIEETDINVLFDTMFYSEDSDVLILLKQNGALSSYELIEELDKRNIFYNQVIFEDNDFTNDIDYNVKPIWFAREKYVLNDALKDSKENGFNKCVYYPNVTGNLSMEYLTKTIEREKVDGRDFKGLIELEDKLILLVNQNDKRNLDMRGVFQVTQNIGIMTNVNMTRNVDSLKNNKQYIKG